MDAVGFLRVQMWVYSYHPLHRKWYALVLILECATMLNILESFVLVTVSGHNARHVWELILLSLDLVLLFQVL